MDESEKKWQPAPASRTQRGGGKAAEGRLNTHLEPEQELEIRHYVQALVESCIPSIADQIILDVASEPKLSDTDVVSRVQEAVRERLKLLSRQMPQLDREKVQSEKLRQSLLAHRLRHRLKARGQSLINELVEKTGGTLTAQEVADYFGTSQDAIRKQYQRHNLFAFKHAGRLQFPVVQLHNEAIRGHLPEIMKAFPESTPAAEKAIWLLSHTGDYATRLEALADPEMMPALHYEASHLHEQGAL